MKLKNLPKALSCVVNIFDTHLAQNVLYWSPSVKNWTITDLVTRENNLKLNCREVLVVMNLFIKFLCPCFTDSSRLSRSILVFNNCPSYIEWFEPPVLISLSHYIFPSQFNNFLINFSRMDVVLHFNTLYSLIN